MEKCASNALSIENYAIIFYAARIIDNIMQFKV